MARVFGKGRSTCLKRVVEYTKRIQEKRKIQLTKVIVTALRATVSCHAVGFLSVRDIHDFDPLEDNGG
jgi:hypothetical protein